jgi:hypothetical protein
VNPPTCFGVEIDEIVECHDGHSVFTGHDQAGHHYLAAVVPSTPTVTRWIFAPISRLALRCVLTGRAEVRDAFRHTLTGCVELVSVDREGRITESIQLCPDLSDELLPIQGERLACVA